MQDVLSQSSFDSVNDSRLHFALCTEKTADIEIRWPSGLQREIQGGSRPTSSSLSKKGQDWFPP
jgi:hypothetical protein